MRSSTVSTPAGSDGTDVHSQVATGGTLARFVAIGLSSSIVYGLVFLFLEATTNLSQVVVGVLATAVSTVLGSEVHRRFTFRSTDPGSVLRGQRAGIGMAAVGLVLNSFAVAVWNDLAPSAGPISTLAVVYTVNGVIGLINFAVLRRTFHTNSTSRGCRTDTPGDAGIAIDRTTLVAAG